MPELESSPVRLIVVRHGQQQRSGHDGPLTELGRDQAVATASAINLVDGDRLVASTLRRAFETATAFGRAPEQVADLDEFRFGPTWAWGTRTNAKTWLCGAPRIAGPGESLCANSSDASRAC